MNKKVLVLFIICVLVLTSYSTVGIELKQSKEKNIVDDDEKKSSSSCPLCSIEEKIKNQNPEMYDLFSKRTELLKGKFQTGQNGEDECYACLTISYLFLSFTLLILVYYPIAIMLSDMTGNPIREFLPCYEICKGILWD